MMIADYRSRPRNPHETLRDIARQLHDGFFAQGTEWGDVDDIQRKLEAIYRPLVEAGYLAREKAKRPGTED